MNRPEVFKVDQAWLAVQSHDGWTDVTPFDSWASAYDHACWLAWVTSRRAER